MRFLENWIYLLASKSFVVHEKRSKEEEERLCKSRLSHNKHLSKTPRKTDFLNFFDEKLFSMIQLESGFSLELASITWLLVELDCLFVVCSSHALYWNNNNTLAA